MTEYTAKEVVLVDGNGNYLSPIIDKNRATYHPPLLSYIWSDHIINDIQWLRADTFSWQSGDVYATVYNTLIEEYATGVEEIEGSVTFRRSSNGFKIATSDMESAILNKYNSDGISWYYILDTDNVRFKLPILKYKYWNDFNITLNKPTTLPVKGNGKILGFTNGASNGGLVQGSVGYAFVRTSNYNENVTSTSPAIDNFVTGLIGVTTDASKSGVVAEASGLSLTTSKSIIETGFYLYFYVGEYAREAIEQTAGLNAEMFNGKVDLNASNLSTQGKSLVSGLGMPSNRYIDLTLGASGTAYTAPANGYFFSRQLYNNGYYSVYNGVFYYTETNTTSTQMSFLIPCKKGDVIYYNYHNLDTSQNLKKFIFIYAEGEQ